MHGTNTTRRHATKPAIRKGTDSQRNRHTVRRRRYTRILPYLTRAASHFLLARLNYKSSTWVWKSQIRIAGNTAVKTSELSKNASDECVGAEANRCDSLRNVKLAGGWSQAMDATGSVAGSCGTCDEPSGRSTGRPFLEYLNTLTAQADVFSRQFSSSYRVYCTKQWSSLDRE